ncbi:adenylate/guanylate cyclase domain-containing protein [Bacteroidota bacterium]
MTEDRRHIAVMFTDICGYTNIMGSNEDKAFDMLKRNHTIHATLIKKHNGTLIKEVGDGTLCSFPLASDAVRCAMDIQREAKSQNIPLKIGIHEGEMVMAGADVLGDSVNVASRLEEMSEEGCITISGTVYKDIKNKTDITTKFIGDKKLKGVDDPVKVYEVLCEEEQKPVDDKPVKSRSKYAYFILGGCLVVTTVVVLLWQFIPSSETIESTPDIIVEEIDKSIAVLPFKNLSPDADNQYFADGVAEGILNHLSKIKDLRVASRTSVEKYREGSIQSPEIGKELNVTYLLEASVFKSEDKIRVTAQLINAINDEHIWSEQYDRELEDVFEVMSDISQEVASEVKVVIAPDVKERIESIPTENLEAYDLYLKGLEYQYKGGESNLNIAILLYQQAIELDPQFALVYVSLGLTYHSQTYWSDYFEEYWGDTLLYFADKALSINPDLAEGYWLRGFYYQVKGDLDKSIIQLEKAIELYPNYGNAFSYLGLNYLKKGQYIIALMNLKKAKLLQIGNPDYYRVLGDLFNANHGICDYEKTEIVGKEMINNDSLSGYGYLNWLYQTTGEWEKLKICIDNICAIDSSQYCWRLLGKYYLYIGDFIKALKYYERYNERIMESGDLNLNDQFEFGYILYNLGRKKEAKEYFNKQIEYCLESIRLKRRYATDGGAYYDLSVSYAFLGEKEKAYQRLHELEREGFRGDILWYSQNDPMLKSLWNDEEFKQIIQRQEKKYADIRAEIDRLEEQGLL